MVEGFHLFQKKIFGRFLVQFGAVFQLLKQRKFVD
jgi:hypothetical protein